RECKMGVRLGTFAALLLAALLFSGCVVDSVEPLYFEGEPADVTLGLRVQDMWAVWRSPHGSLLNVSPQDFMSERQPSIRLVSDYTVFYSYMALIGDQYFLDVTLTAQEGTTGLDLGFEMTGRHVVLRISTVGTDDQRKLLLSAIDPDWLNGYLELYPDEL